MFGPPTYSKKTKFPEYIYKKNERTAKYHHAAYAYFFIGIVYLIVFYVTMPPHDFGVMLEDFIKENIPIIDDLVAETGNISYDSIINFVVVFAGTLFLGLSYFIYNEYRSLVIILAAIYAVRFIIAAAALYIEDMFVSVKYVLPLIGITFYMLVRAAWDLKA